jgi:hypothetical protein
MTIAAAPIADWPVAFGLVEDDTPPEPPAVDGTDYPSTLPLMLRASKSRSQPAAFRMSEPRRGFPYVDASGTDTPVFYDVAWCFTTAQAQLFQTWFTVNIQRGVLEFKMPIKTEFGLRYMSCRFLPDGILDTTENGPLWMYRARIVARQLTDGTGGVGAGSSRLDGTWTLNGTRTLTGSNDA